MSGRRIAWLGAVLLIACRDPATPPVETAKPEPEEEPEEVVAPVEDPGSPGPELESRTWRFTTLVTGATEAYERLIGSNGYYELVIVGDPSSRPPAAEKATVRKVGQKGTPRFPDEQIQTGVAPAVTVPETGWPNAERRTVDVELSDGKSRRRLVFDLWFIGDELHGTWAAPNPTDDLRVGDTWGLVQGVRETGDPIDVGNGNDTPCMVCVRAFWNCDGISFEQPACNSAESSWSRCEARIDKAVKASGELPRGCDDYFG